MNGAEEMKGMDVSDTESVIEQDDNEMVVVQRGKMLNCCRLGIRDSEKCFVGKGKGGP